MIKKIIQRIKDFNKAKFIKAHDSIALQPNNSMIELLRDDIRLSVIPDVFQLLLNNHEKIKLQSAEILNYVMNILNSTQLIKVDKIFRERARRTLLLVNISLYRITLLLE